MNKLERKFGKYAITRLIRYIVVGTAVVYLLCMFNSNFVDYLALYPAYVKKGQIWRLLTFLFIPSSVSAADFLWVAISLYFYYFIGNALENRWGAFRFNVYYLLGVVLIILSSMLSGVSGTNYFLNESLFLAFAALNPEVQVLLFFFIPIKVKWLGYATGALLLFQFVMGGLGTKILIAASLLNFLIFFGNGMFTKIKDFIRRKKWQKASGFSSKSSFGSKGSFGSKDSFGSKASFGSRSDRVHVEPMGDKVRKAAFHRCVICGKTELDDPNMQFRFCAECDGAKEYCMDHLYNHTHVKS